MSVSLAGACALLSPPWEVVIPIDNPLAAAVHPKNGPAADGHTAAARSSLLPSVVHVGGDSGAGAAEAARLAAEECAQASYYLVLRERRAAPCAVDGANSGVSSNGASSSSNSGGGGGGQPIIVGGPAAKRPREEDVGGGGYPHDVAQRMPSAAFSLPSSSSDATRGGGGAGGPVSDGAASFLFAGGCFANGEFSPESEVEAWLIRSGPILSYPYSHSHSHSHPPSSSSPHGTAVPHHEKERADHLNGNGAASPPSPIPSAYGEAVHVWHGVTTLAALGPKGLSYRSVASLFAEMVAGGAVAPASDSCAAAAERPAMGGGGRGHPQGSALGGVSRRIAADISRLATTSVTTMSPIGSSAANSGYDTERPSDSGGPAAAILLSSVMHTHAGALSSPSARGTASTATSTTVGAGWASSSASAPPPTTCTSFAGGVHTLLDSQLAPFLRVGVGAVGAAPNAIFHTTAGIAGSGVPVDSAAVGGPEAVAERLAAVGSVLAHLRGSNGFSSPSVDASAVSTAASSPSVYPAQLASPHAATFGGSFVGRQTSGVGGGNGQLQNDAVGRSRYKIILTPDAAEITARMTAAAFADANAKSVAGAHGTMHSADSSDSKHMYNKGAPTNSPPPPMVRVDICLATEEGFGQLNFATMHLRLAPSPFRRLRGPEEALGALAGYPPLPPPASGGLPFSFPTPLPSPSSSILSVPSMARYLLEAGRAVAHHQQWAALVPALVGSQALLCEELSAVSNAQMGKEEELLSSFVALLNAKKAKIRELLEAAQQRQAALEAQRGTVERQAAEIVRLRAQLAEEQQRHCDALLQRAATDAAGGGGAGSAGTASVHVDVNKSAFGRHTLIGADKSAEEELVASSCVEVVGPASGKGGAVGSPPPPLPKVASVAAAPDATPAATAHPPPPPASAAAAVAMNVFAPSSLGAGAGGGGLFGTFFGPAGGAGNNAGGFGLRGPVETLAGGGGGGGGGGVDESFTDDEDLGLGHY